jgi:hypothetical protein
MLAYLGCGAAKGAVIVVVQVAVIAAVTAVVVEVAVTAVVEMAVIVVALEAVVVHVQLFALEREASLLDSHSKAFAEPSCCSRRRTGQISLQVTRVHTKLEAAQSLVMRPRRTWVAGRYPRERSPVA